MSTEHIETARSLIIALYNHTLKERASFSVPMTVAAPFVNRLLREVLPDWEKSLREPWYMLIPHCVHQKPLCRSRFPVGPTSLYGTRYEGEREPSHRVRLHPDAHIVYFAVRIFDLQNEIYQGEYSVDDIFLAGAEFLTRNLIEKGSLPVEEGPFYYTVLPNAHAVHTVPQDLFPPDAYAVEGVFRLPDIEKDRQRIQFRKVPPPPLPERVPSSYAHTHIGGRGKPGDGRIVMRAGVYRALREEMPLNAKVEDGGYLLGYPYRQPGSPESEDDPEFCWWLEITDVVRAEGAWGGPGAFLFTGETWSQIARRIDRDDPDKKLVSWFHTHLFQATDEFGLSGMDQELHRRFLTRPWQIAVLLNIDGDGTREVRCFQRGPEGDLVECTFEVMEPTPEEKAP